MTSCSTLSRLHRASEEMDSSKNHMIVDDGYNRGRDYIVERATAGSRWKGMWWKAEVEWREGLLERGKRGMYLCTAAHSCDNDRCLCHRRQPWHRARWPRGDTHSLPALSIRRMHPALTSVAPRPIIVKHCSSTPHSRSRPLTPPSHPSSLPASIYRYYAMLRALAWTLD